jgi:hypothetical protein
MGGIVTTEDLPIISNLDNLKAAIPAARTQEQRAHVYARGHELGYSRYVPVHWNRDGSMIRVGELA